MTTTMVRLLAAAVFAVAAWLSWSESQLAARVADARESAATFDYSAIDEMTSSRVLSDYIPGERRRLADEMRTTRSTMAYWLGRYDGITAQDEGEADADVLLTAANAAFRASLPDLGSAPAAAQKLDGVLQAYASAIKAAPGRSDAAYNYEYVSRLRDQIARASQNKATQLVPAPVGRMGGDLPLGPTIHGGAGGPPPEAKVEELQTIMPMEYGDREAQPEATPGARRQRKG